jgi:hypothetical protein
MLRVAVEAESVIDLPKLERGLRRLHRADPAVEVTLSATGEQVTTDTATDNTKPWALTEVLSSKVLCFTIVLPAPPRVFIVFKVVAALGELHLEQCLKDLREKHARCAVRASAPLLSFREGLEAQAAAEGDHADSSGGGGGGGGGSGGSGSGHGSKEADWEDGALPSSSSSSSSSVHFPAQLRTPPWASAEECGAAWALKGGGSARVVAADGSMAITIRVGRTSSRGVFAWLSCACFLIFWHNAQGLLLRTRWATKSMGLCCCFLNNSLNKK